MSRLETELYRVWKWMAQRGKRHCIDAAGLRGAVQFPRVPDLPAALLDRRARQLLESFHGSGIYQVLPANWLYETKGDKPMMVAAPQAQRLQGENWWENVWTAAHFSLLSAVNIGFEQFTPGDWVRRLQQHEYELQAVGWVRIVAGAQALLSVFFLRCGC